MKSFKETETILHARRVTWLNESLEIRQALETLIPHVEPLTRFKMLKQPQIDELKKASGLHVSYARREYFDSQYEFKLWYEYQKLSNLTKITTERDYVRLVHEGRISGAELLQLLKEALKDQQEREAANKTFLMADYADFGQKLQKLCEAYPYAAEYVQTLAQRGYE